MDEIEFLRKQGRSTWCGGSARWIIPHICKLCGEGTDKGEVDVEGASWICFDCKKERDWARRQLSLV